jgi:hypothetical protein
MSDKVLHLLPSLNTQRLGAMVPPKPVPFHPPVPKRQFGALRGIVVVGPEFFEPLAEPELGGAESASRHSLETHAPCLQHADDDAL